MTEDNRKLVIDDARGFSREEDWESAALATSRSRSEVTVTPVEESRILSGVLDARRRSVDQPTANLPQYNDAIQDSRMTFALFVATKFIPEHVEYKTLAGQQHYQAILKHLITPETVNRIFNPRKIANARLKAVSDWPYLDETRLCEIRTDHIRHLVSAAHAAGYSAQTVKHIKNVLFIIISHAQTEGCFTGPNPASLVKLPKIKRATPPSLTSEQTKAVPKLLPSPDREIALFALTTDMNFLEICDLKWKHVNMSNSDYALDGEIIAARTIAVRTSWNRAGLGDARSVGRIRDIEIREPLFVTLKELRKRNPNATDDSLVITSQTGGPIVRSSARMGRLTRIGKILGLPWLNWQVLRRAHPSFFHADSGSQPYASTR